MSEKVPDIRLVPIKAFRPLLELLQPMENSESTNLKNYVNKLLPAPKANYMHIERFYCFASAVESLAYRRSRNKGEEARALIYAIIKKYGEGGDFDACGVPTGGPAPTPRVHSVQLEEPKDTLEYLDY